MTEDKLYDIFDLDIDFETAYNMLENNESPMTNLLTSPKQLLILSPKKEVVQEKQPRQMVFPVDEKSYTFDTWDAHNTPYPCKTNGFNEDVSSYTKERSVPVEVQNHPKKNNTEREDVVLLSEPVAMTLDGPGALAERKTIGEPNGMNNLLNLPHSPNAVFVPSGRSSKGKASSYDLLSVNESHAIENFLDSLMDNHGNSKHFLPEQGRPVTPLAHDQLLSSFINQVKAETPHSWGLESSTTEQIASVGKKTQSGPRPPILGSSSSESVRQSVPHSSKGELKEERIGYEELSARYHTIMEKINVKKNKHLENERKRRAAIKTSFDLLKSRIRYPRNDGFDEKVSKIRVKKYEQLQFVIEDIEGLLLTNEQLRQKIRDLGQWHNYESLDKSV